MWLRQFYKGIILLVALISGADSIAASLANIQQAIGESNAANFVDPGRVSNQIQSITPRMPSVSHAPIPKIAHPQVAPLAGSDKIRLKLNGVIFKGNTIFKDADLQPLLTPLLHKVITLTQLQDLVHQITVKYRQAGYILSHAVLPPQTIKEGIVRIQIIEGFISHINIKGNPGKAQFLLESYGKYAMMSRPLQIHKLERYTLLANDIPGLSVQAVLTPSKSTPGGADLTFVTQRKRGDGYISYDNFGTKYLGPKQVTIGGDLYSLFLPGDSNALRFIVTTRPHELRYGEFVHGQFLGTNGAHLTVGVNYAETRPRFILEPLMIAGRSKLLYFDVSYPLIRDRENNLIIHSTFNYQNVTSTILGFPFYDDRIRSLVLGFSYDRADSLRGTNTFGLDMTHGFNILGAKQHEQLSNGHSQYTRFNPTFSRLQALSSRVSVLFFVHGQYSYESLVSTEQFGVGGYDIGRGYDPSEIVGDHGISGKFELRLDTAPQFRLLQAVQYYAFYDMGKVWNIDPVTTTPVPSLTSVGCGARINFMPNLYANFFIARPLTHSVATQLVLGPNDKQIRSFFQITASV
jgi:hemolysin activation/secretion protein